MNLRKILSVCLGLFIVYLTGCSNEMVASLSEKTEPQVAPTADQTIQSPQLPAGLVSLKIVFPVRPPITVQSANGSKAVSKAIPYSANRIELYLYGASNYFGQQTIYNYGSTTAQTKTFGTTGALVPAGSASLYAYAYDANSNFVGGGYTYLTVPGDGSTAQATVNIMDAVNWSYANNSSGSSYYIGTGTLYNDLSIHDSSNFDWYYLYLSGGSTYVVDTSLGGPSTLNDIVTVYDPNLNQLAVGNHSASLNKVIVTPSDYGYYYIKVESQSGTTGLYSLKVDTISTVALNTLYDFVSDPGTMFNGTWTYDTTAGNYRSGVISHSQMTETDAVFIMPSAQSVNITFTYGGQSEANYDFLHFYLDGVEQTFSPRSGNPFNGTFSLDISLASGAHTLTFSYSKDGSVSVGNDFVWIDDLLIRY